MSEVAKPRLRGASAPATSLSWIRTLVVLLLAVASLTAVACSSDTTAKAPTAFSAEDGRFKAEFPGSPKREEQRMNEDGLDVVMVMYATESKHDAVGVGYVDFPFVGDTDAALNAAAESAASEVNGKLESKVDTTYQGQPAKDVVVSTSDGTYNARVFVVGQRMYIITGAAETGRPASYDHLLATFALL